MAKLWGGRFSQQADQVFARFNASLPFDRRLLDCDLRSALAHCRTLQEAGAITPDESGRLQAALRDIAGEVAQEPGLIEQAIEQGVEDVHSFVEGELARRVGDLGLKLNTGRSRNDQVATDFRLYLRRACDESLLLLRRLQRALLKLAEDNGQAVLPGYTHMQRAQPLLWPHYLLAYVEMLDRDAQRFAQARRRINYCPLGSAALAGTNYPVDRRLQARLLGFEEVSCNSVDAIADRDFLLDYTSAASILMMHLSRLCEDWILYSSSEFGFLEFGDAVTTGSSLMPQKKNPDALELIRGKAARVFAAHQGLLVLLKGLPLSYNKDLQEDKEGVFDCIDTVLDCLQVTALVARHAALRPQRMKEAAQEGYLNATELADYLVRKGLPFRRAHDLAGQAVLRAIEMQRPLEAMPLEDYRQLSDLFEDDLYQSLTLESTLKTKDVEGGTAPRRVEAALEKAKQRVRAAQDEAEQRLQAQDRESLDSDLPGPRQRDS
ncbi:MAG TPA: argininosuccinate lyase [Acidobacteriota bacterium]|nr:argininosuccinate lyase [Acidobacteriota bacterium]